uniref:Uncharacterized protein n=1 Tax=Gopherus agassizii TaxID=38772 RepID=A0A452I9V3_9SAUR
QGDHSCHTMGFVPAYLITNKQIGGGERQYSSSPFHRWKTKAQKLWALFSREHHTHNWGQSSTKETTQLPFKHQNTW